MKYLNYLLCLFLLLLISCSDELGPNIDLINTNTGGPTTGAVKRVLIEEFTGVRCVNCPEGSDKIKDLLAIHDTNLVAISIHAGFFAEPYPENQYDFQTTAGTQLEANLLGPVSGYPAATINRKLFDNEFELPVTLNKWAGYINQELQEPAKLTLDITPTYTPTSRNVNARIVLKFLETITAPIHISVLLTEDGVQDAQLTPSGIQMDYTHNHIFRKALTNYNGDRIIDATVQDEELVFNYSTLLPREWVVANCHIIAFVSQIGGDLKVLQVNEVNIL